MSKTDTINIHRMAHDTEHPYVIVNRDAMQNKSLSFAARGMLAYILSQSDSWEINITDLQQECGRDTARKILNELVKAGHILPGLQKRVKGRFTTATPYQCYESPKTDIQVAVQPTTDAPQADIQVTVKPSNIVNLDKSPRTDKPRTDKPQTVEPTEESNKDKKVITKKEKIKDSENEFSHRDKTDIIQAWFESLPAKPLDEKNPYVKKGYISTADKILEAGYTVEDVERYTTAECAGFYKDKKLAFGKVLANLPAWIKANPSKTEQLPYERELTAEDLVWLEEHNRESAMFTAMALGKMEIPS